MSESAEVIILGFFKELQARNCSSALRAIITQTAGKVCVITPHKCTSTYKLTSIYLLSLQVMGKTSEANWFKSCCYDLKIPEKTHSGMFRTKDNLGKGTSAGQLLTPQLRNQFRFYNRNWENFLFFYTNWESKVSVELTYLPVTYTKVEYLFLCLDFCNSKYLNLDNSFQNSPEHSHW